MKPNPPRPRPPGHTGNPRPPTNREPHQPSPRTTSNPTSAPTKPENASRPPTGQTATAKNCTTLKTAHTYPTPGKQPPLILPQPATNDQRQPNPKKRTPDLTRHQLNHRPPMDRGPGQLSGGLAMRPNPPRPFPHRKPPPAHQPATPPTFTQDDGKPTRRPTHPGQTRNLLSLTNRPNRNNGQNTHHAKNRPPHTTQPENTHRPPTNREPHQPSPRTTANPTSAPTKPENTSPRPPTCQTATAETRPHIPHNRETPTAHPPPARNERQAPSNPKKRTPDSTRRLLKPPPAANRGLYQLSDGLDLASRRPRPARPDPGGLRQPLKGRNNG